jgi:hypothetical protein
VAAPRSTTSRRRKRPSPKLALARRRLHAGRARFDYGIGANGRFDRKPRPCAVKRAPVQLDAAVEATRPDRVARNLDQTRRTKLVWPAERIPAPGSLSLPPTELLAAIGPLRPTPRLVVPPAHHPGRSYKLSFVACRRDFQARQLDPSPSSSSGRARMMRSLVAADQRWPVVRGRRWPPPVARPPFECVCVCGS